jgi:4-aminobutyrate aminotransferase-like enzyme
MDLVRAEGSYIWVAGDETPYLDLVMAFGSTNFGHAHPDIIKIVQDAALKVDNTTPLGFSARNELSQSLVDHLPFIADDFQVHYTIGGAKCVESALEVARIASGKKGVVSFKGSFHGYATSVVGVSDTAFFTDAHAKFKLDGIVNINFPTTSVEARESIELLRTALTANEDIGTVIIEAAQGLAGFRTAPQEFFVQLQQTVTASGAILIVDDILLGMGRVGSMYSFGGLGLVPDMVLLGKSLAGGYYPLSAIIARQVLFDRAGVSRTSLDSTFSNNPFGIYIANEIQKMIVRDNIFERSRASSVLFDKMLHYLLETYKKEIVSMFVMGFAGSIRLKDNDTAKRILEICLQQHVLIQLAGLDQDHIRLTPSLLSSSSEIGIAMSALDLAFSTVLS